MKRNTNELTALEEKAALLKAQGNTHPVIAEKLDRSMNWVDRLSMKDIFQEKVLAFEQEIKSQLKAQIADGMDDVLVFRERLKTSADDIHKVGAMLLAKITKAIEDLDSEDIPISKFGSMLKNATDAVECSVEMSRLALGIDELVDGLVDVQKAASTGSTGSTGKTQN
ncbi:hypothetical protein [Nostoc sp. UHCC 0870]|uniref:hypothetical protein n=1 Tax=Nostoc sp. UHCC 0870 TaxID=2914041 RepID=UPI001EE05708|nr:hypothetical protein [Nostoc sp. UHCC 0870]UKP01599.1 hypothetical protein L6494_30705 [Nostoc sp. UHCC 0870]